MKMAPNIRFIGEYKQIDFFLPLNEWCDAGKYYRVLDPALIVVREYNSSGDRTGRIKLVPSDKRRSAIS
jgi:hypothetical protein